MRDDKPAHAPSRGQNLFHLAHKRVDKKKMTTIYNKPRAICEGGAEGHGIFGSAM